MKHYFSLNLHDTENPGSGRDGSYRRWPLITIRVLRFTLENLNEKLKELIFFTK